MSSNASPTNRPSAREQELEMINQQHEQKLALLEKEIGELKKSGSDADGEKAKIKSTWEAMMSWDGIVLGAWLFTNVATVVLLVAFNKVLYKEPYNFKFGSSLMCFNFAFTYAFVVLAKHMGWYTPKRSDKEIIYVRLGLAMAAAVGFVNLSLLYNTLGMYQLIKFSNIMVICILEYFWLKKTQTLGIYISLVVLTIAVMTATVSDVGLTPKGMFFGALGVVCTAVYQILQKKTQADYDLKPLQLLEHEQPYTVMWTALLALFTDDVRALFYYNYTAKMLALLFCSGVFAFFVNVSSYMIIGKTGPITYGVLGHSKAVGVLAVSFFALKEIPSFWTGIGMLVAFGAIVVYTHLATIEGQKAAAAKAAAAAAAEAEKSRTEVDVEKK